MSEFLKDPCPKCGGPYRVVRHRKDGYGHEYMAVSCETCKYVERKRPLDAPRLPELSWPWPQYMPAKK